MNPNFMRRLLAGFVLVLCCLHCTAAGKVVVNVCQGPFCAKYGCKNVLLAANLQPRMSGKARGCFGKRGCESSFTPQQGVTVSATGLGTRTLKGCSNPFAAKSKIDAIAKEFGL